MSRKFSDVEIDESLCRRPLRQRAKKVRQSVVTIVLGRHRELEGEIGILRPLFLDRLIVVAFPLLNAEVNTSRRRDQDNTELDLGFFLSSYAVGFH